LTYEAFRDAWACAAALMVAVLVCAVGAGARPLRPAQPGARLVVFIAARVGHGGSPEGLDVVARSGRVLRVLSRARFGTWGRWSPDDASIAWEDPSGIRVETAGGSSSRVLVPVNKRCPGCGQLSFIWSPDSRALVVGSAGPGGNQLQLVPIDGSAPTVLVASSDAKRVFTPSWWTPDGRSLIYVESRSVAITGAWIRMLTPATGKTATLWSTPTAQGANAPLISPNLRYWAYVKEIDQYHEQVRIVDKQRGSTQIVAGVNSTNLVGWSPDSKALAVIASGGHVVTVSPNGRVLHLLGPGEEFFWGRNSSELFILRDRYTQLLASENGRPPRLLFRLPKNDWLVSLDAN
jgi:hypothetical protein